MRQIGDMTDIFPERVRASCTPEEIMRRVHGVEFGEWSCPSCGLVAERSWYPVMAGCPGCSRWLPDRCSTPSCDNLVQPECVKEPTEKSRGQWDRPWPYCQTCVADRTRAGRAELVEAIPAAIRSAAVDGYWGKAHRRDLDLALAEWVKSMQYRRSNFGGGHGLSLFVYGSVGGGKTVAVARAAIRGVLDNYARDLTWIREWDLITAAKSMYGDDEKKHSALLKKVKTADLLVIDELFTRPDAYTEHASVVLGDALAQRFEAKLPTLMTSNEPPIFGAVFDQRVMSRFEQVAKTVQVVGPDLRQAQV